MSEQDKLTRENTPLLFRENDFQNLFSASMQGEVGQFLQNVDLLEYAQNVTANNTNDMVEYKQVEMVEGVGDPLAVSKFEQQPNIIDNSMNYNAMCVPINDGSSNYSSNPVVIHNSPSVNYDHRYTISQTTMCPMNVATLDNFEGNYNFSIDVPAGKNKKTMYSETLKTLYCHPRTSVEVKIKINDPSSYYNPNWVVRVCPVFQNPDNRVKPVLRCHNCKSNDMPDDVALEHMVKLTNPEAWHFSNGGRHMSCMVLGAPPLGADCYSLFFMMTCRTACIGGPNRRPFSIVFSLIEDGREVGRSILPVKCAQAPSRDMRNEEANFAKDLAKAVEEVKTIEVPGFSQPAPSHSRIPAPHLNPLKRSSSVFSCSDDDASGQSGSENNSKVRIIYSQNNDEREQNGVDSQNNSQTGLNDDGITHACLPTEIENEVHQFIAFQTWRRGRQGRRFRAGPAQEVLNLIEEKNRNLKSRFHSK